MTIKNIRAMILDMDGVLWRESEPIGDLPSIFNRLTRHGIRFVLATNNSTRTVAQYVEKVRGFNIPVDPWQILTSSLATASLLKEMFPGGGPVFVVGEQALVDTLQAEGFYQEVRENVSVLAVVAGMDRILTYAKLKRATFLIRSGVPFIGSNPDRSFPTPQGLAPGAGAVLAAIQAAADVTPQIAGKPAAQMYQLALERLGTPPDETLVVGDRPETDILGGQKMGCQTALVLSGVVTLEQARVWQPPPTFTTADFTELVDRLHL